MGEIEPLRGSRTGDHADLFDAVAHGRHLYARDQHGQRLRNVLRGQPERARTVLVDHQLQVGRLLVPVELRVFDVFILLHDVADLVGDLAHLLRIRADHAELHREADRRAEIEAVDADPRLGEHAVFDGIFDFGLDALARLYVV